MTDCDICGLIEKKNDFRIVYEDNLAIAFVHEAPIIEGQIILMPKQHFPIVEQTPDEIFSHLMNLANIISIALFEALKAQGTNVIINNGTDAGQNFPHLIINIIPRKENDSAKLDWEIKKASPESIKMNAELITKYADKISLKEDPAKIINAPKEEKKEDSLKKIKDSENYKIRQLRRIP